MKKVGIVTIYDNNYGNRLQNYAVQEILKGLDCDVITIKNTGRLNKKQNNIEYLVRNIRYIIHVCADKFKRNQRDYAFLDFNRNIKFSKRTFNWFHTQWLHKFDYFITGSDQVWNPKFRLSKVDLLSFAEPNKRISLAASIANDDISDNLKGLFYSEVKDYKAISVREDSAKEIVERITKRADIQVLVDPTMLIDEKKWSKLAKKPEQLKSNKFILCYFLGDVSDEINQEIRRIADENDCDIISLMDKSSVYYQTGPSEFLYLEKNSFFTITDSFHSCVFSILFDTPFVVCDRQKNNVKTMGSRIDTLLSKFELENRKFNGSISDDLLKCDYSNAKKILENEQKKANNFIKRAIDI